MQTFTRSLSALPKRSGMTAVRTGIGRFLRSVLDAMMESRRREAITEVLRRLEDRKLKDISLGRLDIMRRRPR